MRPPQVLLAHLAHVFAEAASPRGLWLCHTHALTSLHRVPIAKLMHMLVAQTAAGVVCDFLFLPVPMWAASVFTSGDRHPLTSKYGG